MVQWNFHCLKDTSKVSSFQERADWSWPCLVCTSGEKQPRASSYKQGRIAIAKTPENKRMKESWLLHTITSVYGLHPQCCFAQESYTCLFPKQISPILMAKTPMSRLYLSEHWCGPGSSLCSKGIPKVFSVEEGSDLAWDVLLGNTGKYHRASSYDQGKMDIPQMSQSRVWKHHVCRGYSTQWMNTSSNVSSFR